jgi:hypothetical protein
MIKALRPGPSAQYFARKPPQTLEKLHQKMDEYIRADNDFRQRREEAYRFSEIARGFRERIHPRHVRSIHNTQSDDRGSLQQRLQYSSQASGQQQSYPRPPAPRGRGARGFGGRFGDQPRKIYCLFCGEDKGHTTRMGHVTIQKQKEIAEAAAQQSQPKQVMHTASYHSPYILEYVGNHPAASVASASQLSAFRPRGVPGPTSKLSQRVLAQMCRRETEHEGGKGDRQKGKPAAFVLSCAQVGCACSRGLQASTWEREREPYAPARSPMRPTFSYESPGPSFYRRKERAQVYNGGCSSVLTCLTERS